jgi:hypothetical protein
MPVSPSRPDFRLSKRRNDGQERRALFAAGPEPRAGFSVYRKSEHGEDPPLEGHEHFGMLDQVEG